MSLKPWREIATPHKDVLAGTFKQSEFAADITSTLSYSKLHKWQGEDIMQHIVLKG